MTSSSSSGKKVLVINGPNLNLLGTREPEKYGSTKLEDVIFRCNSICTDAGATLLHFQSNHEGAIIDRIHAAREEGICGIVINAGALTHTSVGLRDALTGVNIKFLEVHVSLREELIVRRRNEKTNY